MSQWDISERADPADDPADAAIEAFTLQSASRVAAGFVVNVASGVSEVSAVAREWPGSVRASHPAGAI